MKIRFNQNVQITNQPEFLAGEVYEVEDNLAHELVVREVAEFAPTVEEKKKSSKKS